VIDRNKFDKAKRFLRRKYPISKVHVIFVPRSVLDKEWKPRADQEVCGDFTEKFTENGESRYVIRICNALSTRECLKTLAHEWAHILQHSKKLPQQSDHDRLFKALEAYLTLEILEQC
jgi:hypothetical protein